MLCLAVLVLNAYLSHLSATFYVVTDLPLGLTMSPIINTSLATLCCTQHVAAPLPSHVRIRHTAVAIVLWIRSIVTMEWD